MAIVDSPSKLFPVLQNARQAAVSPQGMTFRTLLNVMTQQSYVVLQDALSMHSQSQQHSCRIKIVVVRQCRPHRCYTHLQCGIRQQSMAAPPSQRNHKPPQSKQHAVMCVRMNRSSNAAPILQASCSQWMMPPSIRRVLVLPHYLLQSITLQDCRCWRTLLCTVSVCTLCVSPTATIQVCCKQ